MSAHIGSRENLLLGIYLGIYGEGYRAKPTRVEMRKRMVVIKIFNWVFIIGIRPLKIMVLNIGEGKWMS